MPDTVELGQLVLSYPRADLQLELTARLTASQSESLIGLQQCHHQDILTQLISKSTWVSRGSGLHLVIQLQLEGQSLSEVDIDTLTTTLSNADLWNQLNLRASAVVDPFDFLSIDTHSIRLDISYTRTDSNIQTQASHRIDTGVSSADIKPPDGIRTIGIESVFLKVKISKASRQQKDKRVKLHVTNSKKDARTNDTSLEDEKKLFIGLEGEFSPSSMDLEDMMLLDKKAISTKDGNLPLQIVKTMPISMDRQDLMTESSLKRVATLPEIQKGTDHVNDFSLEAVTSLLDAAFRMVICKSPSRLSPGIRMKKCQLFARLADIAPSLWSPNHLTSVSQRSCLLPTLSRALTRTVYLKSRSMTLRSKIDALCERGACSCDQCRTRHSLPGLRARNHDKTRSINTELWSFLTTTLSDSSAARRLKPLRQTDGLVQNVTEADFLFQEQRMTELRHIETFMEDKNLLYEEDSTGEKILTDWSCGTRAYRDDYQESEPDIEAVWFEDVDFTYWSNQLPALDPCTTNYPGNTDYQATPNSDDILWECLPPYHSPVLPAIELETSESFLDSFTLLEETEE